MVKEKNSEVGVVHGSFTGVSDSIPSRALGSLAAALLTKLKHDE